MERFAIYVAFVSDVSKLLVSLDDLFVGHRIHFWFQKVLGKEQRRSFESDSGKPEPSNM